MSKADIKVAKRYAKALFESCSAPNYDSVSQALAEVSASLEDTQLRSALLNPSLSVEQRSSWLSELLISNCPSEAKTLGNLVSVVIQNQRVDSLPALAEFFAELLAHYKKLLTLEVASSKELNAGEKEALINKVKGGLPADIASGVNIDWRTEAELLGGLQVRVGDKLLDGSVSGAINKIARELHRGS